MRPASRVRTPAVRAVSWTLSWIAQRTPSFQRSSVSPPSAQAAFTRRQGAGCSLGFALRLAGMACLLAGLLLTLVAILNVPTAAARPAAMNTSQILARPRTTLPVPTATGTHVDVLTFDRAVDPASARYLVDAISTAEHDGATALVVTLDTPGGDIASMEAMEQAELASTVPILVWVGPSGAFAASAGTFLALAAPVVAMAPNTTIGAASPVNFDGTDIGATEKAKIESTLTSIVNQLQQTYGRTTTDADLAITQAKAYTEPQAVGDHMVNLEATSVSDLLAQEDGQTVTLGHNGTTTTLHLAGLPQTELQPSFINQVEAVLFDPNFEFVLFIIAVVCIYLELAHPGAIVPGTVGVLALILFLLGAQALSPDWAGFALMLVGFALLVVDVRVPTHGVLTVGGLFCLALGAFIFFDSGVTHPTSPGISVSPALIIGFDIGVGIVALLVLRFAAQARRSRFKSGAAGLVGQDAQVLTTIAPEGRVRVLGEDWAARLDPLSQGLNISMQPGQTVRVLRVDGLVLIVEPVVPASALQKGTF